MIAAAMGWIGTLGTISAYVMLSRGRWNAGSIRYGVLNLLGGLLGAAGSTAYGAWPSVASNLIWACVALQSIVVTMQARRAVTVLAEEPVVEPVDEPVRPHAADPWPDTLKMPAILNAA
jgi:hypothetical protein